jgi:hypothetical protein
MTFSSSTTISQGGLVENHRTSNCAQQAVPIVLMKIMEKFVHEIQNYFSVYNNGACISQ